MTVQVLVPCMCIPYRVKQWQVKLCGKITLHWFLNRKTSANLVSVPLHFNAVKMFGWETLANGWTIANVSPPTFRAV